MIKKFTHWEFLCDVCGKTQRRTEKPVPWVVKFKEPYKYTPGSYNREYEVDVCFDCHPGANKKNRGFFKRLLFIGKGK